VKHRSSRLFAAVVAIVITAWLFTEPACHAKTVKAASCQYSDVTNAVGQASVGDTVQLPAGTAIWTQTLTLNGVSLNGSGSNTTVIVDEENRAAGGQMILLYPAVGALAEISNLQLCGGVTNTSLNDYGSIAVYGTPGTSWRIDHNIFNGLYAKNICTYGNSFSVIDHNTFYEKCISIEDNSALPNDGEGDQSYAQPPTYGLNSSNVLYVEDNYITNLMGYVASVGACDGEGGARIVFRHNTVWNDLFNNHGTETGGRDRGERSFEIYNNSFNFSSSSPSYPCFAAMLIRSGCGVIFSNTCNGYYALTALRNYRYTDAFTGQWEPFGGATGFDGWDSNSPTIYLSGTSSAPNGSLHLQVNGANWQPNQWYGYTLYNTNSGMFSVVITNSSNTMYYLGGDDSPPGIVLQSLTFNSGDHFQVYYVYAALDQPGRGSGDLVQDAGQNSAGWLVTVDTVTGVPSWPREVLEPIYCWSNTVNGALAEMSSVYPGLKAGRDFYNDTPMPGYTPFVYPHPLVGNSSTTNSNGNSNSTNTLQPPSNLQFNGNP
jgi:hypothetical protein